VKDVIDILKTDDEYWFERVYEGYPPQMTILPVVSVYVIGANDMAVGDGKGMKFFKKTVSVDIWTKEKGEEMQKKAIDLVYNLNRFVKLSQANVLQEPGGVKHINLNFIIGGEI